MEAKTSKFYLNKWYLDVVDPTGSAHICYAAELQWKSMRVPYASLIQLDPDTGGSIASRFRNIQLPELQEDKIHWMDTKFKLSGEWVSRSSPIHATVYQSPEGSLSWMCHQPAAYVNLIIDKDKFQGVGYCEQLLLTVEPWKIPMDELRWGRFISDEDVLVWISLKERNVANWVWHNGTKIEGALIHDDTILLPDQQIELQMDRGHVIESEKKIQSVVRDLVHYLPGFNRSMPMKFLLSDEKKWLSRGTMKSGKRLISGWAIHELVNFNP